MTRTIVAIALVFLLAAPARAQVPRFEQTPDSALAGLRAADAATRRGSSAALARFKNSDAARAALSATLLQDPDVSVRQAAATALAKLGAKARGALVQAAVCDPDSSIRNGLNAYGRRAKILCHAQPAASGEVAPLPRAEEQLLAFLGDPSPVTRQAAARDLAKLQSTRGMSGIWDMASRDPVWSVRASALRILARHFGKKLLPVLKHNLTQDPDARVREVALEALAFIKDPQSVSWISASAKTELVPTVQLAAVKTLAKIGDKNAVAALADLCESPKSDDVRAAAVEALATLPGHRRAAQPVIARVLKQSRSGKVRAAALKALSSDNSAASCSARAERINDPDAEVRRTVVEQLAKCPASVARPALVAAARDDKDAAVRKAALGLLVKAGAAKAQEALVSALQNDRDASIRRLAVVAVLALPKKARAAALAEAAKGDSDTEVRRKAVQGLKTLDAEIVVPALAAVLARDRVAELRADAARILSNYSDAAAYQALQRAAKDSSAEVRKIAASGAARSPAQKAWVDALLPQVIDPSVNVRLKAVNQICPLQVPRTYRALLVALWTDENASVRTAVARCFADLDHPLVDIGLSVAHTTDGDGGVIRTVELSQRQRVERQNKVLEKTKSTAVDERVEAARTLQPSPAKQVRETLERLLDKDADPRVRRGAATVMVQYKDRRALQKLNQVSQTERDPATRQAVATLYNHLRTRWSGARNALNINTLITQLRSVDAAARIRAAQALGTLRDRRAFNPLREASAATDPALRHAAAVALATFGDLGIVSKAARTEADAATKASLIQLNYLRNATPEKIIAALASTKIEETRRGVEAASIKQVQKAVPWLVRLALSHGDKELRLTAVRALVLYDLPLAQWAIRVASDNDASKRLQEQMWLWAVHADAGTT